MVNKLSAQLLPEMQRINQEFVEFSKFIGQNVVILEGYTETGTDENGKDFEFAVMYIEAERPNGNHLVRSSGKRIIMMVKAMVEKDLLPIQCKFTLVGKSHMMVEPDEIPF